MYNTHPDAYKVKTTKRTTPKKASIYNEHAKNGFKFWMDNDPHVNKISCKQRNNWFCSWGACASTVIKTVADTQEVQVPNLVSAVLRVDAQYCNRTVPHSFENSFDTPNEHYDINISISTNYAYVLTFFSSVCSKYTFGSKHTVHGLGNAPRN